MNILDIGTGSGCILLSILKKEKNLWSSYRYFKKSNKYCKYNAKIQQIKNRIKFYISDVDNFLIGKYDLIYLILHILKNLRLNIWIDDVRFFEPKTSFRWRN